MERITPEQIRQILCHPHEVAVIHRCGNWSDHEQGEHSKDCWCAPLLVDWRVSQEMHLRDIARLLTEFYAVH